MSVLNIIRYIWNFFPDALTDILSKFFDAFCDRYLGITTKDIYSSEAEEQADLAKKKLLLKYEDPVGYEPTPYHILFYLAAHLKLTTNDILIDLGSGSGRVVFFFARKHIKKTIGVEFDVDLFRLLEKNEQTFRFSNGNIEFFHVDSAEYEFTDENIIFMFNPFGEKTMNAVIDNLEDSLKRNNRIVKIIYANPLHHRDFMSKSWITPVPLPSHLSSKVSIYEARL